MSKEIHAMLKAHNDVFKSDDIVALRTATSQHESFHKSSQAKPWYKNTETSPMTL